MGSLRILMSQLLAFTGCLLLLACNNQGSHLKQEVALATLELKPSNIELISRYSATIKGRQDIEIRAQVSGFITELHVDEGAIVSKGQTLFVIDQVPYQAAYESAKANVEAAKASLATAQLTLESKQELFKQKIISAFDLQTAQNTVALQKATLRQCEAQCVSAHNNLSYTEVKSPSNGVVGNIPFRIGSLVSPTIQEPLTTVSDNSEMYIYFSMTEKQLLAITRQNGSLKEALKTMPAVGLELSDGKEYQHKGKIETISGVIDPSTGAVTLRASFNNPEQLLSSGGSGALLYPYQIDSCIIVPQSATYEIQDKRYVYTVDDSSRVHATIIEVLSVDNGKEYVVSSGLKSGDKIVLEGIGTLKDGSTITTK